MRQEHEETLKKQIVDKIIIYCKKLKKHAQENKIDLSNIYIAKR